MGAKRYPSFKLTHSMRIESVSVKSELASGALSGVLPVRKCRRRIISTNYPVATGFKMGVR